MKLLDIIVCDDIRREIGNKQSLMGVYAGNIILARPPEGDIKWPVTLRLGFFMRFMKEPSDIQPDAFRVEFVRNDIVFDKVEGSVVQQRESENTIAIALVNMAFKIMGVGPISFRIEFSEEGKVIGPFESDYRLNVEVAEEIPTKKGDQKKKKINNIKG